LGLRNRGPAQNISLAYFPRDHLTHLDSLGLKTQTLLLVREEVLDVFALVALKLDYLSHLRVRDDGAIAGKLLLDHLEDLLLVEFLRQSLDRGQGLASIALYDKSQYIYVGWSRAMWRPGREGGVCEVCTLQAGQLREVVLRVALNGGGTYVGYECGCSLADSA
jgi:hypothetical protein